ncbi:hypothetical protein G5V58_10080 [Nocardioides anomalus]|uniref:Uncharacterized protein n=1 Tax=Nocardioides anomalus TaxID=2712223 RepID=A0A6G6WDE1_9ACTN|nr:hypothetical protein [Nocardioides anomalus]QIG43060.1 hypothetical protein G5V58_10080 [Nocardioides anomalus]
MYADNRPCQVCGAEVELRARTADDIGDTEGAAAPDATVDERVCTHADCPTRRGEGQP